MPAKILIRRGIGTLWASQNPILATGEIGLELNDSGGAIGFKFGNGTAHWSTLPYFTTGNPANDVEVVDGAAQFLQDGVPVGAPITLPISTIPGPTGDRGYSFAGLTPALDGSYVQGLVESADGVVPVGDPIGVSLAYNSTVTHGSTASTARPPVSVAVIWIGSVQPTNAVNGDVWLDTSGTAPTILTAVLDGMNQGAPATQALAATGTTPLVWTVSAGALPTGVALSTSGQLSGNPTSATAYDFTVTAENGFGSDTQQYTGTTGAALAPTITTTVLAGTLTAGLAYSQTLAAEGSVPLTWTVQAGALPTGLALNGSTGVISGTPTTDGAYDFTIRVANATDHDDQEFTGTVLGSIPTVTTTSLNGIYRSVAFSQTLTVTGSATITWSVQTGALPTGLSLNTSTGAITGTTTATGSYDVTVRATNSNGHDDQEFTGTLLESAPSITETALNTVHTSVAFSQTFHATGLAPLTWSVQAGALLTGFSLDGSTGTLTGTLTASESYDFTIRVTNATGHDDQQFTGHAGSVVNYETGLSAIALAGASALGVNFTAPAGSDVFVWACTDRNATVSATYGGTAMTLVASNAHTTGGGGTFGGLSLFRLAGGGTGASVAILVTASAGVHFLVDAEAYSGVSSLGTPVTTAAAGGTATVGPISCNAGERIIAGTSFGCSSLSSSFGSPTGGVNRKIGIWTSGAATNGLATFDTATSGTTFAAIPGNSSMPVSSIAVVLVP